jgi:TonB family protein
VQHLEGLARPSPQLPVRGALGAAAQTAVSLAIHIVAVALLLALIAHAPIRPPEITNSPNSPTHQITIPRLVFIAPAQLPSGGGGGGGNRQNGPIRHAEGIGHDAVTLRIAPPLLVQPRDGDDRVVLPGVVLDARPLASGSRDVMGLPEGGVSFGFSTGPGSGGGVGEGAGTGIGSGVGPGIGPGFGGGTGGGTYRAGGAVTSPRVITQVKPKYTDYALAMKIQGTVILDVVVKSDGRPGQILVTRSLDAGGLDEAAIAAAREWRFEPGRLGGTPVDVLVTLILDFRIQ